MNELDRNHGSCPTFLSSQNSTPTQDANFRISSDLHRQGYNEGHFRPFGHTTVRPDKHPAQGDVLGQGGFISGTSGRSQSDDLLNNSARMMTAVFFD